MKNGTMKKEVTEHYNSHGLLEYLLVAPADELVSRKVAEEQQYFVREYGEKRDLPVIPHITVAQFRATEAMEGILIRWIQRICSVQTGFVVTLNNYSGFPPDTIYLRVQDPLPFQLLAKQLKAVDDFIRSSSFPAAQFKSRPYLSIAGSLPEQVYGNAMIEYSQRTFHETFMVHELLLLRCEHVLESCKTVNVFRFLPQEKFSSGEVA